MNAGERKMLAREILRQLGPGLPFGSGQLAELAAKAARRRGRPRLAENPNFIVRVAAAESERRGGPAFTFDEPEPEPQPTPADTARKARETQRKIREDAARSERERTTRLLAGELDVEPGSGDHKTLARAILIPLGSNVSIGSGKLVQLSIDEAQRRGKPELATQREFLEALARRGHAGKLSGRVLDF